MSFRIPRVFASTVSYLTLGVVFLNILVNFLIRNTITARIRMNAHSFSAPWGTARRSQTRATNFNKSLIGSTSRLFIQTKITNIKSFIHKLWSFTLAAIGVPEFMRFAVPTCKAINSCFFIIAFKIV